MKVQIASLALLIFTMTASAQVPPIEPGVPLELAKWRAEHYSDIRYELDLTLVKMAPTLKGSIAIEVTVSTEKKVLSTEERDRRRETGERGDSPITGPSSLSTQYSSLSTSRLATIPIVLDWRKISGHEKLSRVFNVKINGNDAVFEEVNEHLVFRRGVLEGKNRIELDFESPILTSGSAITRYVDKEDGSEYIYSLFVPSDASTAFPVFDQPDLKARFKLHATYSEDWHFVSNSPIGMMTTDECGESLPVSSDTSKRLPALTELSKKESVSATSATSQAFDQGCRRSRSFLETKPISTYVFAFAAGPFQVIEEPTRNGSTEKKVLSTEIEGDYSLSPLYSALSPVPIRIFVRKSQAHKLLPPQAADAGKDARAPVDTPIGTRSASDGHNEMLVSISGPNEGKPAAKQHTANRSPLTGDARAPVEEVFRLNREAIEYLEDYFDYPFPFRKYDVILIPEFPFGGMEHAGATFLRETSVIFPTEPTANNYISRASLIFHEAAHQWFGDTVTMKWFDDLWLKEGFATFMAYKTMEKVLPEYDPWKVFYQRTKSAAYQTDVTRGTTPIHQELPNLSAAKSAYGNIVYQKAPSFLKQAEFFWGEESFREAVRAFLKHHEFGNATWHELVGEIVEVKIREEQGKDYFKRLSERDKEAKIEFTRWQVESEWAEFWVSKPGTAIYRSTECLKSDPNPIAGLTRTCGATGAHTILNDYLRQEPTLPGGNFNWVQDIQVLRVFENGETNVERVPVGYRKYARLPDFEYEWIERRKEFVFSNDDESEVKAKDSGSTEPLKVNKRQFVMLFPNYRENVYGIYLLEEKSRNYILKNIRNEKDDFLRAQMWGSLWDSVRFAELAPLDYINLAIANIDAEKDETTISSILGRTAYAFNYYLSEKQQEEVAPKLESLLIDKMKTAPSIGQRITYYRALLGVAKGKEAREALKALFVAGDRAEKSEVRSQKSEIGTRSGSEGQDRSQKSEVRNQQSRIEGPRELDFESALSTQHSSLSTSDPPFPIRPKDKFDITTRLIVIGDPDGAKFLAELEKTEKDDAALRWAYAAKGGFATKENKAKYWRDFTENKEISESWIEAAFDVWNAPSHSELTLPYLADALAELPNLKRDRKIFFVNGWLGAFIGGQDSQEALDVVNKFLEENQSLDADLRRKILENVDGLERAVKIRSKFGK